MNYFYFPIEEQTPIFGPGVDKEDFLNKKDKAVNVLDKAVYLSVMHKIWRETSLVLQDSCHKENLKLTVDSFWVENKYLLDYVNAVYNLKELLENYDRFHDYKSRIYSPVTKAYNDTDSWFRFICEFRNCLIHRYSLVKDFDMNGRLWICIDEFIDAEQDQLNHDQNAGKTDNRIKDRQDFISRLDQMPGSKSSGGKRYEPVYLIVEKADLDIGRIMNAVYDVLFSTRIEKALKDLLSFVHHDDSGFYNTVYVEEDYSYEPCCDLESYLMYFAVNAGPDSNLTKYYASCLQEAGYNNLISQRKKTVDEFLDNVRSRGY